MGITRDELVYDLGLQIDESVHLFEQWAYPICKTDENGARFDSSNGLPSFADDGKPVHSAKWQIMFSGQSYKWIVAEAARKALGMENIEVRGKTVMQKSNKERGLFKTLQKLQAKLAVAMQKIQTRAYHPLSKSTGSFDMTGMLEDQVEELALKMSKKDISVKKSDEIQPPSFEHTHNTTNSQDNPAELAENTSGTETEFAKYLNERKHAVVSNPAIGQKLQDSIWEHVHSAIRYARQGDVATAKLHSKIAATALEESGHYLNNEEYSELVLKIKNYFSDAHEEQG